VGWGQSTTEGAATNPFSSSKDMAGYLVAAAVWAPSVQNTQPWWFVSEAGEFSLYADAGRQLTAADPAGREMLISCGAALFTARLALRSLGWIPEHRLLPDPAERLLVARLRWRRRADPLSEELRLFGQVWQRRSHRGGFDPVPLTARFLAALRSGAERYGATLRLVSDPAEVAALAAVVRTAEEASRLDGMRVREAAVWASPPGSRRPDGVPATAYPARSARLVPDFPTRDFAHGCGWGLPPSGAQAGARWVGQVCVLTTVGDDPVDWVNAGQALQRMLLTSSACGVAAAMHSQPIESDWLRASVRAQLGGGYPQVVLRLGTVAQNAVSVRRPPADVLSHV